MRTRYCVYYFKSERLFYLLTHNIGITLILVSTNASNDYNQEVLRPIWRTLTNLSSSLWTPKYQTTSWRVTANSSSSTLLLWSQYTNFEMDTNKPTEKPKPKNQRADELTTLIKTFALPPSLYKLSLSSLLLIQLIQMLMFCCCCCCRRQKKV